MSNNLRDEVTISIRMVNAECGYALTSERTVYPEDINESHCKPLGHELAEALNGYDGWMGFCSLAHALDAYPDVMTTSGWPQGDEQLGAGIDDLIESARRFLRVYETHTHPTRPSDAAAH